MLVLVRISDLALKTATAFNIVRQRLCSSMIVAVEIMRIAKIVRHNNMVTPRMTQGVLTPYKMTSLFYLEASMVAVPTLKPCFFFCSAKLSTPTPLPRKP